MAFDHNSVQFAKFAANPRQAVKANEWGGRVRAAFFDFDSLTLAQNDVVGLAVLPRGARVIGGFVAFGDFGTGVSVDIGTYTLDGTLIDVDWFADGIDVATAAGTATFADTEALHYGEELAADVAIGAIFLGANPDDTVRLSGHILYMLD